MKALVHIIYITSTSHGQSLDGLDVSVEISPKMDPNNDKVYFPLRDLNISTNKSTWHFSVQQIESQCVSMTIFDTISGTPSPISNLSIPLSQFSINQTVRGEFKMIPTTPKGQSFTVLVEICVNNNIMSTFSNESNSASFKKNLINKTLLQPKKPSPTIIQPRNLAENPSPKSRPLSLPISTFNTFQNDGSSFSTQSDTNDQNSYNSASSSSVDSVQLDLSESSDDQIQERKEGEDDSSSSYLSESSKSEESKDKNQNQERDTTFSEGAASKSGDKSIENSEEKQENQKKHRHRHRHHHHHHRHHQHQHDDRVHYHKRSHHHHHHHHHHHQSGSESSEQQRTTRPRRLLRRQQLDEANIGSQRILKPQIRTIASDRNIHRKRGFITERQSALNLAVYCPHQTTEPSNIATGHPRILKRNANNHIENPFLM